MFKLKGINLQKSFAHYCSHYLFKSRLIFFRNFMSDSLSLPRALITPLICFNQDLNPIVWWSCVQRSGTVSSDMCTIGQNLMS